MDEVAKLQEIKVLLKTAQISYDEAKEMAEPYLNRMNERIKVISKRFKMSPKLISFSGFMR